MKATTNDKSNAKSQNIDLSFLEDEIISKFLLYLVMSLQFLFSRVTVIRSESISTSQLVLNNSCGFC